MSRLSFLSITAATLLFTSTAYAETPNLKPGLWSHTTTTVIDGPMSFPPQSATSEQCVTQEEINKGVDMLNIPQECKINQLNIKRDSADFSVTCTMQGMPLTYSGQTNFHGENMDGSMQSAMDSPMGKVSMNIKFTAKRTGGC